jgi:hypothetical protein
MANYYVKPDGDDGDDGTTFALAKATLAGVYALTGVGDTIYVCSSEAVPFVNDGLVIAHDRQLTFIGASAVDGTPYTGNTRAVLSKTSGTYIIYPLQLLMLHLKIYLFKEYLVLMEYIFQVLQAYVKYL